jgi:hypothetical protein
VFVCVQFFLTVSWDTGTFMDGDALDKYYKLRTVKKIDIYLLFPFRQYYQNMKQQY